MAIELPDGRRESNDVLEALRLRAVHGRELGYAVVDIAAILGVRQETVSRWCSRYDHGGQEGLPGDRTGRPVGSGRRLTEEQEQCIQQLIDTQPPQELKINGFTGYSGPRKLDHRLSYSGGPAKGV
jgi:transposase